MNHIPPYELLADHLEEVQDRQIDIERTETNALYELNQLLEYGEFARVENIFREIREKLPRKDAA